MQEATSRAESHTREVCEGAAVECSRDVLEELRRISVDGFNAFAHGGREVGGVLYGVADAATIRVFSYRELNCEYARGPRFLLSEGDHATLLTLLEPEEPLQPVGWFRSHTRGGLELDAHDREFFDRYFAQPLSLSLILKPTHWGPATAAFFARSPLGGVLPQVPREFPLDPVKTEGAARVPIEAPAATPVPAVEEALPAPAFTAAPLPVEYAPETTVGEQAEPRYRLLLWLAAVCLAGILIALAAGTYASRGSRGLRLQALAVAPGQVRFEWDAGGQAIPDGASGTLAIQDGDAATSLPLNAVQVRAGSAVYVQRTSHVSAHLDVNGLKPGVVNSLAVEFVGAPAAQAPEPPQAAQQAPPKTEATAETVMRVVVPVKQFHQPVRFQQPLAAPASTANAPALPTPPVVAQAESRPAGLPEFLSASPLPPGPARAVVTPPAAPASVAVKAPVYSGPRSGRMIWTGSMGRRGVIELEGNHASNGSVSGALPGVPVAIRAVPAEFSREGLVAFTADALRTGRPEAPSAGNGWNALHFKFDGERARQLVVLEAPNRANEFKRLVLRNDGRDCPVVVVDWTVQ